MGWAGAQPIVDASGGLVETVSPGRHKPGSLVRLPRIEDDLARHEQLAAHQGLKTESVALGEGLNVARPCDMHVVSQTRAPPGGRLTGPVDTRQRMPTSHPQRPQVGADGELVGLDIPLSQMVTGLIDNPGLHRRGRQR